MLLTASSGRAAPFRTLTSLLLLAAVPLRVPELLALFDGGRLDLGAHDVLHGLDPVRHDVPLLAVPLLDEDRTAALVVLARDLDRMREALHPDLVEALLGEIEILEAPANLLAGRRLALGAPHRRTYGLRGEHRVHDAAVVERRAHLFLLARAFALVVAVLHDVGVHREVGARRVERRALVPLGAVTGGNHVGVARRPPVADEVIHLEADGRRFLHGDLIHDAPARHEDPVG